MLDVAIIGGGPAGLSAGLYATRGGLKNVVMFEKGMPGGQITSSSEIENYPGVAQVMDGISFMAPWSEQCMRFGLKHRIFSTIICTCFKASSKLKVLAVSLCALEKLISLLIRSIFLSHSLAPKAKAHSVSRISIFFIFNSFLK